MTAWMRVAGLAVAFSIAESCSLKPPEMPRLDVSADAARIKVVALAGPTGDLASARIPAGLRIPSVARPRG